MRHRSRHGRAARALLAVVPIAGVVGGGCASYHGMALHDRGSAATIIEHSERDGLHVAVRDLSSKRACERHFGAPLTEYGYVPVQMLFELDAGTDAAYDVRREDLRLVLRDGTRLESSPVQEVVEAASFSHWRSFFGYLLLLPGPFVSTSVSAANRQIDEDYTGKALRSVRLSPNLRSYEGVVFFRVPEDPGEGPTLEDAFVEVVAHKEGEDGEDGRLGRRLDFPVHFAR